MFYSLSFFFLDITAAPASVVTIRREGSAKVAPQPALAVPSAALLLLPAGASVSGGSSCVSGLEPK